jgi:hypothetical protein
LLQQIVVGNFKLLLLALGIAGAMIAAACSDGATTIIIYGGPSPDGAGLPSYDDDSGMQGGVGIVDGGAGTGANTGLPCDVQQMLEVRCIACHSTSMRLLTYADLHAPSGSNPKNNMAQESLARMKGTGALMPPMPAVPPTAQEIATFEAWVTAGAPMGPACTNMVDGGGNNPYNTQTVCTSGKYWTSGTSMSMRPGEACQACHQKQGGPNYSIAGTVYPTAHEPKDCYGSMGGINVVVTDKNNKVVTVPVSGSSGNFGSNATIVAPFFVKVTAGNTTRAMIGSLTNGDCNSCHTETGANNAPGRVMAP